jgi:hypothetical protein
LGGDPKWNDRAGGTTAVERFRTIHTVGERGVECFVWARSFTRSP